MNKHYYVGDINAEYGGYFMTTDNRQYNYSEVVRIQPCSDAGGPDNLYWIESLTVNIPDDSVKLQRALDVCGISAETYKEMSPVQAFNVAVDACISYGYFDQDALKVVQVGKCEYVAIREFYMPHVDVQLRANASIRNYALNVAHGRA